MSTLSTLILYLDISDNVVAAPKLSACRGKLDGQCFMIIIDTDNDSNIVFWPVIIM